MEIVKSNQLIKCDVKPVFEHINTACDKLKCSKIVAKVFAYIGYSFSIILPLTDLCILLGNMCSLKSTSSLPQVDGPQVDVPQRADEQEVDEQVAGPQSTGARLYPPTQTGDQAALTRVLGQWATPYAPDISAMMAQMLGIDTNPARPLPTTFSLKLEYAGSGVVLIDGLDVPLQTECSRYDFIVSALLGRPDFDLYSGFLFFSPDRKELTVDEINNMEVSPGRHMPLAFIPVEDQELIQALAAIKANYSLENFYLRTPKLQDNRRVVLAAVAKNGREFAWVSKRLQADFDVALAAVNHSGWALEHASKELKDNENLVLAAITQNGRALKYASARLREDRDIVLPAITQDGNALEYASKELQDEYDLVVAAIANRGSAFRFASERLRKNRDIALAAVTKEWRMIYYTIYQKDPELILAVINSKEFDALEVAMGYTGKCYIKDRGYINLREDHTFMLSAINKNYFALEYASKELQDNLKLVLAAVTQVGSTLRYASPRLKADEAVVLAAVTENGSALQYASPSLKADQAVVLAAVTQNGSALEYASPSLKADQAVVLAAVTENGSALQYASPSLKADQAVVLAAVRKNGLLLRYASEDLRNNRPLVLIAVRKHASAFHYASAELQVDPEVIEAARRPYLDIPPRAVV